MRDGTLTLLAPTVAHVNHDVATAPSSSNGPERAHEYHILFMPHRTELTLLSLEPIKEHVSLLDLGIELVPLEPDLLSCEEPGAAWSDLYLTGDQSVLHRCAMILMTCEMVWGTIPRITGKGDLARRLADLVTRQRREHLAKDPTNPSLNTLSRLIDGLVIVERGTDLVTPMCSQLTYTGLMDEFIGIKSSHVEVDASVLSGQTPQQQANAGDAAAAAATPSGSSTPLVAPSNNRPLKNQRLDVTTDAVYEQLCDLNFSTVGMALHNTARKLTTSYEGRHSAKTVPELRAFVGKLGGLQGEHAALRLHTAITEKLMSETKSELFNRSLEIQQNIIAGIDLNGQLTAIEDLINLEAPLHTVLRLLCLYSTTQGGLKAKIFDHLKREICQAYGYQHVTTLLNLEKAGMLNKTTTRGNVDTSTRGGPASVASPYATAAAGVASGGGGGGGGGNAGGASSSSASSTLSGSVFERVRQPLRLVNDEVSESDPTDIAYVYSGYAPLSVRLVQAVGQKDALVGGGGGGASSSSTAAAQDASSGKQRQRKKPRAHPLVGWKGFEDVVNAIPGETFDFVQGTLRMSGSTGNNAWHAHAVNAPTAESSAEANAPWATNPDRKRTTIVFFLGGITYAEIAAIRFMSRQSRNRTWLIITTGIVTGGRMLDMAMRAGP